MYLLTIKTKKYSTQLLKKFSRKTKKVLKKKMKALNLPLLRKKMDGIFGKGTDRKLALPWA